MSPFSFLANIYAGRLIRPERHGLKHQGFLGVGYAQPKEALLRGHSMRTNPAENRKIGLNSGVKYHFILSI